jgi:hypothetical protein
MLYQLFEYSDARKKKYRMGLPFVLVFSQNESNFNLAIKRLKRVDPNIKTLTEMVDSQPKVNLDKCTMFPGSQEDVEALYKE